MRKPESIPQLARFLHLQLPHFRDYQSLQLLKKPSLILICHRKNPRNSYQILQVRVLLNSFIDYLPDKNEKLPRSPPSDKVIQNRFSQIWKLQIFKLKKRLENLLQMIVKIIAPFPRYCKIPQTLLHSRKIKRARLRNNFPLSLFPKLLVANFKKVPKLQHLNQQRIFRHNRYIIRHNLNELIEYYQVLIFQFKWALALLVDLQKGHDAALKVFLVDSDIQRADKIHQLIDVLELGNQR